MLNVTKLDFPSNNHYSDIFLFLQTIVLIYKTRWLFSQLFYRIHWVREVFLQIDGNMKICYFDKSCRSKNPCNIWINFAAFLEYVFIKHVGINSISVDEQCIICIHIFTCVDAFFKWSVLQHRIYFKIGSSRHFWFQRKVKFSTFLMLLFRQPWWLTRSFNFSSNSMCL